MQRQIWLAIYICLQIDCRGGFGLLCTDVCGAMPFRFLLKEKQAFLSYIALLNEW